MNVSQHWTARRDAGILKRICGRVWRRKKEVVSFSIFDQIKDRVSTREAAERYGLAIDRYGKTLCPFHEDYDPSMKIS